MAAQFSLLLETNWEVMDGLKLEGVSLQMEAEISSMESGKPIGLQIGKPKIYFMDADIFTSRVTYSARSICYHWRVQVHYIS